MGSSEVKHYPIQVIENTLPLGMEGAKKYLGAGRLYEPATGINIAKTEYGYDVTIITITRLLVPNAEFGFKTVKKFEVDGTGMEKELLYHLSCGLMTTAFKEHSTEIGKVECIFTRNPNYKLPKFGQLYPIAVKAYKSFIDGKNEIFFSDN